MDVQNFDATNIPPQQMGSRHPVGTFPFQISNTYGAPNKNTKGGQFVVELTSPAGTILNRYNLWNENAQAVEIAQKELSALCHAVGVFQLAFVGVPPEQYGRELRGARGTMKVDLQDASKPDGFVEVKKVFDAAGNEPGKGPAAAPQTQQSTAWAAPANQQQAAPAAQWGNAGQAPANTAAPNAAPQGWSQGPSANQTPANTSGAAPGNAGNVPPWAR